MTAQRIAVTLAGGVPQPSDQARTLTAAAARPAIPQALEADLAAAAAAAVSWQVGNGVDIVSDGAEGRLSVRLGGFDGPPVPFLPADLACAGDRYRAADSFTRGLGAGLPSNTGRISYDPAPAAARIARFQAALAGHQVAGAFLAAPSPGTVTLAGTSYYRDPEKFLAAAAVALRQEYRAITAAGLTLQVDAPDLAMSYHAHYQGMSVEEFRARAQLHADVLNDALAGIDPRQVRLHVCWGSYAGPHHRDIPLAAVIDILYSVRAGTLVLEGANPRHRADWRVFADHKLPAGMILAAGVIDTATAGVEAPAVVADAIVQVAGVVSRERVIAATDCGFSAAGTPALSAEVAGLKVQALRAGADLATRRLWRHPGTAAA